MFAAALTGKVLSSAATRLRHLSRLWAANVFASDKAVWSCVMVMRAAVTNANMVPPATKDEMTEAVNTSSKVKADWFEYRDGIMSTHAA